MFIRLYIMPINILTNFCKNPMKLTINIHFYTCIFLHCVLKNVTTLSYYNFDIHESISMISGRNVTEKVSSQKMLYFSTSPN